MAEYIVDDGGNNADGLLWSTAYTSLSSLLAAETIAAGDVIYVGHNHVDGFTYSATKTYTGPAATTAPATLISVTQGTGTIGGGGWVYQAHTANQLDSAKDGAFAITMTGNWAMYGIRLYCGARVTLQAGSQGVLYFNGCSFGCGPNNDYIVGVNNTTTYFVNCEFDLTQDGSTARTATLMQPQGVFEMVNPSFVNAAFRTGNIVQFGTGTTFTRISGGDWSGFSHATTPELFSGNVAHGKSEISNIKTAATHILWDTGASFRSGIVSIKNSGSGNQSTQQAYITPYGHMVSGTTVNRTGGATETGVLFSWGGPTLGIETTAGCSEDSPFLLPWIYGTISATGTYQFDVYIGNNTADFNDNEVWLEVEYKDDATSGEWSVATDKRVGRVTTPVAQTDETSSTWNGDALTFKQILRVSGLTVGTVGQFRCRVAVGVASIAASRDFYVDPKVTVT